MTIEAKSMITTIMIVNRTRIWTSLAAVAHGLQSRPNWPPRHSMTMSSDVLRLIVVPKKRAKNEW